MVGTEKLHTDRLEERYGPVQARIIEHTQVRRIIDIVDATGVSRTHAVTWFPEKQDSNQEFEIVKQEIASGSLIGKTFRKYGFAITKVPLGDGIVVLPQKLRDKFDTQKPMASASIYAFMASKDAETNLYGVVCEIYHPDFLKVKAEQIPQINIYSSLHNTEAILESLEVYLTEN